MTEISEFVKDVVEKHHKTLHRFEIQYMPGNGQWQIWIDTDVVRFTWPIEPENVSEYVELIEAFSGGKTAGKPLR